MALARANEIADAFQTRDDPAVLAEALYLLGSTQTRLVQWEAAEATLYRAVLAAESARDTDTESLAWTRLAWLVGSQLSRREQGLRFARHATATLAASSAASMQVRKMGILTTKGSVEFSAGAYAEALELHTQALKIGEQGIAADDPRLATPLVNIGLTHFARGEPELAMPLLERALAVEQGALGRFHPRVATTVDDIGLVLHDLGDHQGASEHFTRALEIRTAALGRNNRLVSLSLRHLGDIAHCAGKLDEAHDWYDQMSAVDAVVIQHPDRQLARNLVHRGELALDEHDTETAGLLFDQALDILTQVMAADHHDTAYALTGLGRVYLEKGEYSTAVTMLERSLKLREHDDDRAEQAVSEFALAQALWRVGETLRAVTVARSANRNFVSNRDPRRNQADAVRRWLDQHPAH